MGYWKIMCGRRNRRETASFVTPDLIICVRGRQACGGEAFGSGDIFTINSANGNYYLILEVDSGATSRGLNAVIQMNGCYLL